MVALRSACLALIVSAGGCSAPAKPASEAVSRTFVVDQIRYGMSIEDLRDAFEKRVVATSARSPAAGMPLQHHWTTSHEGREAMLVSGHVCPGTAHAFLFIDRHLSAILPAQFAPLRPIDESLAAAIADTPVPIEEFQERCREHLAQYERAEALNEPNIALAPMMLFDDTSRNRKRYIELMDKFDASEVRLGSALASIRASFGEPASASRDAKEMVTTFGREIDLGMFPVPLVSVGLVNDAVVWVRTDYNVRGLESRSP